MNRIVVRFAIAAALLAAAVPAAGDHVEPKTITVTLRVAPEPLALAPHWWAGNDASLVWDPAADQSLNGLPGVAGCVLTVADADGDHDVDGAEILDAAVAASCISGWDAESFEFGRFVTGIDGLQQAGWPVSWWWIGLNGGDSSAGIDDMDLADGDALTFVYYLGA